MTRAEELAEIRHNVQAAEDEGWFEYGEDAVNDVRFLLGLVADAEALAKALDKMPWCEWGCDERVREVVARHRGKK